MAMAEIERAGAPAQSVAYARLGVGLLQGIVLYLLTQAATDRVWPATDGAIYSSPLLVSGFVPVILLGGLGSLRPRTLAIWSVAATAALVGLAVHDMVRDIADTNRIQPSLALVVFAAAGLYIAHHLIAAGDAERKLIASYATYFDIAWKHGVQLVLALCFVGAFWLLLWLGAALFKLIKIDFLEELIRERWFAIPASTTMFAWAIHLTDVRVGLVRGIRTVALTLLSWLLPVMALIAAAFLVALPFTGLAPLWATRSATALLLVATATLVILINATYQEGRADEPPPRALRYGASLTALALVPLVALAAYGLWLRINQYGWTPDRIVAAACVVVAACYALGYALSALRLGAWLKWLEAVNVLTAFVILAVLLALFTPLADPARIAVADQVRRLEAGKVAPEKFDFQFLARGGVRYGRAALEQLKTKTGGPQAVVIAQKAEEALRGAPAPFVPTPASIAENITVYPQGRALPPSFVNQDWKSEPKSWRFPPCLRLEERCEAFLADLDGRGEPEILLTTGSWTVVFQASDEGHWAPVGNLTPAYCAALAEPMRNGQYKAAEPVWKDLDVEGRRFRIVPNDCEELEATRVMD
jgi:hypothetical protein